MSEDILFNPGQAIASSYDYHSAYVAAQIYHQKSNHELLLVKDKNDKKMYYVFDSASLENHSQLNQKFQLIKRI
ncbi:hypothetical protein [Liquorilactobacillus vini]|uniref:Uncharacterized protein n=1 Tax=Liquorilactobacillus vini DSM 20605 TaxID=1133569 RepID=A0A0R2C6C7_9LACO|nr:hypothetical protein [Liquorilactobacillus vini]KRM87313.1 hypothetical protein FD21_GL001306 [Liquorilactobacillus vini DSM 20605]